LRSFSGRTAKWLLVLMLLSAPMISPFTTKAQRWRRGPSAAPPASETTTTQESKPKVTVTRRLNHVRLSAAAIKTIRSLSLLRGVVAVRGATLRPLAGSSLWQLSNGGHLVVSGGTAEPGVYASEVYTRDIGLGDVMVWACYCPGYDANKDDGCTFDGPASALKCKQTGSVSCNCKFEDFLITAGGAVIGFEGIGGD